jgi:DNA-directed RNA polymerase subunit beta
VSSNNGTNRVSFSKLETVLELPHLLAVQTQSFEDFLQGSVDPDKRAKQGLQEVFQSIFPITDVHEIRSLEFVRYSIDEPRYSIVECQERNMTYGAPLKATLRLVTRETEPDAQVATAKIKDIIEQDVFLGELPLMTEKGTFIINGAERVIVSQLHRSPGVFFDETVHPNGKKLFSARIIPYRGSWVEFTLDVNDLMFVHIDSRRKLTATTILRAVGFSSDEDLIKQFCKVVEESFTSKKAPKLIDRYTAAPVVDPSTGEVIIEAAEKLTEADATKLIELKISSIKLVDIDLSRETPIILNTIAKDKKDKIRSEDDALQRLYSLIRPGDAPTSELAKSMLEKMFFNPKRYDLGEVGRYMINQRLNLNIPVEQTVLDRKDFIAIVEYLIDLRNGRGDVDDIDHLGNRRSRSVGELLSNQFSVGLSRMARTIKERMNLRGDETPTPHELVNARTVSSVIDAFFGSSQLSQFMDQTNPLAELTHKRRLSALGPGGLTRERAGFKVRDVHHTHYGRMCPIETPEGPNIGLIVSLANYTRVNEYGFLETPYRKVTNGKATHDIEYLSAMDEERYFIAQANAVIDKDGRFTEKMISVRKGGDYITRSPKDIQYMDVSPKQVISVSASLIPFLEHDDANRALMGSNMQRQAVPLLNPEPPRVGTGMEAKTAYDSGVVVTARNPGTISYVTATEIQIKRDKDGEADVYKLLKYQRTNQDTCFNQKPTVTMGQKVKKGEIIADGPATSSGELALGRNVLVAFMPWNGYNYEDAILISERVVKADIFTSIHIKEFSVEVRETKLGPEKITADIPNTSERAADQLDEEGIICLGAKVKSGSILVGKVTPKSETDSTPEFKLLNSIFGEKAKEVRDTSLRVPHGIEGTVIDIKRLKRSDGNDLNPGVDEVVKVLIATKKKLQEGDKMAGRHGNKGVIACVLPEEDMPFMADGSPVDVVLNPLGVPSRMNVGQILETELGWAGVVLDEWYATPVFQSASNKMIEDKFREAKLPVNSKITLYDGLSGEAFNNDVTVGYLYMLKLHHLVDDKMHARSTGPYSLVTQQPLGGKAQFGGQRLGEMEVWALEAYGAANTLQELLTIKSDDMVGRAKIYESIVKGEVTTSAGIPEAFNVMVQELRGLALDISIFDSKSKQIALTERDEELINRQGSRF